MHFTKMQGIGNDYVYVNAFAEHVADPAALSRIISDRHFGVGSDGLILIEPCDEADFRMRIFNNDGSEGKMCGNGSRCVGKFVYDKGLTDKTEVSLMTGSGIKILHLNVQNGAVESVRVDMGAPAWSPAAVPVLAPGEAVAEYPVEVAGQTLLVNAVSMGNPHCVVFTENVDSIPLEQLGPLLENHPLFPDRTNVEFVQVISEDHIRIRVWERGSGVTLACGTGACASFAASVRVKGLKPEARVDLPGGTLKIAYAPDGHIFQEGPAVTVFEGEWPD